MGTVFCSIFSTITTGGGMFVAVCDVSFLLQPAQKTAMAMVKAAPVVESWRLGLMFIVNSFAVGDVARGNALKSNRYFLSLSAVGRYFFGDWKVWLRYTVPNFRSRL